MRKGITLLEVLVGIVITAILIGIGFWTINRYNQVLKNSSTLKNVKTAILYASSRAYTTNKTLEVEVGDKEIAVKDGTNILKRYPVKADFKTKYTIEVKPTGKVTEIDLFLNNGLAPNCIHVGNKIYIGKAVGNECKK